jgi:tetratricopeptide (TPR) repeat protein
MAPISQEDAMKSTGSLRLARHAQHQLSIGMGRDAAWLALCAIEQDPGCGLALSVLARLILEVNEDALGTLATRHAIALGLPDPERDAIEAFHRIDLWRRGLIAHDSRETILPVSAFGDASKFRDMPRFDPWLREQSEPWGGLEGASQALVRMAAALSDARRVPETEENPLRVDTGWEEMSLFKEWKAQALASLGEPEPFRAPGPEVNVLSDHWIDQEIASLGASGQFALGLERARLWASVRPQKIRPKAALVRLHHALLDHEGRDRMIDSILELETQDLNELEEARIALGELSLWGPQIMVLDRMNAITPDHPVILANRGAALLEIGELENAEKDLEKAIEVDATNAPALATLGLIRMRQDRYVGARELLERAVTVAPDRAQVRVYLAACKNNQGDREGAIGELEEALRLEPRNAQARQLLTELQK